jgi:carbonic anhydrase/acetyltransferase-like protein (isoleucine patch superfamily)
MGANVLSGAAIGEESVVAAGALVPEGRRYPARSLLVGAPARRLRDLTDEDVERLILPGVQNYVRYAETYGHGKARGTSGSSRPKPQPPSAPRAWRSE